MVDLIHRETTNVSFPRSVQRYAVAMHVEARDYRGVTLCQTAG